MSVRSVCLILMAALALPGCGSRQAASQANVQPAAPGEAKGKTRPAGLLRPSTTLEGDSLDAPAATSVDEAARASAMAGHSMSHGSYRHLDAGRDGAPASTGHDGHAMPPAATPADPHAGHHMHHDPPTPQPSPRTQEEKP